LQLEDRVRSLLAAGGVTGASVALLRDGAIELAAAGLKDAASGAAVTTDTVFAAASLSKPMVAYAVLQLADAGLLDLDQPLARHVAPAVPQDPRAEAITARHVLNHSCGLQNLKGKGPLRLYFQPGERFSYSSLGFGHLQAALRAQTGEPLDATVRRLVFEPLGMRSSSFVWQERFEADCARPHEDGAAVEQHRPTAASASYSLQTTAGDYAAFMAAVLRGDRLSPAVQGRWLSLQFRVPHGSVLQLKSPHPPLEPRVGWGLGWGVETEPSTFFQWGKMAGFRAFAMGSVERQAGVVLLTNSNRGLRLMEALAAEALPGDHPAVAWLGRCVTE
jgi:CubicO group peptidase (beta-lactamase class C family)